MPTRDRTRTRLLDAADSLLFIDGVVGTPVDAILERAGVSPATLYRAYPSKDDLVAAALRRRHERWIEVWDEVIADAEDDEGRLFAVFGALERFRDLPGGARWCAFLGTAAEHSDPPAPLAAALTEETTALRRRLTELAEPLVDDHARGLAEELLLVISGELAMRLRGGEGETLDVARRVARSLVDGAAAAR